MTGKMRRLLLGLLLAAAGMSQSWHAAADPRPAQAVGAAPPSGRVGRLAAASGKVALQPAAAAGWAAAETNDPIAAGAALRTEPRSRAAIEIGVDSIDLAEDSKIVIVALDARGMVIELLRGRVGLALRRGTGTAAIDLPQGEVWLEEKGTYDIASESAGGPMRVTAFAGTARLFAGGAEIRLAPGESATVAAAAPFAATIAPAAADAFSTWAHAQAVRMAGLAAPAFVSPDLTGFAALEGAGHWRRTASYGEVWLPDSLPADWAPYRNGYWRWFAPWGWTWIDDAPWGFAPSHYGRWARLGGRWAWVPGSLADNPVYLPAAVAFLGTPGVGVSYAGGNGPAIGWFPLAPGEVYWPSYTQDLDYIRSANRGNVRDAATIRPQPGSRLPVEVVDWPFANRLDASVVPRPVFVSGRPVMPAVIDLPRERLRDMPVVMGSPRIGPPAPPSPPVVVAIAGPASLVLHGRVAAAAAQRASWIETVRLAAIRSRLYRQAVRLRHFVVVHLRASSFTEPLWLRHLVARRYPKHHPDRRDEHEKKTLR
jgi:hypothetical protein